MLGSFKCEVLSVIDIIDVFHSLRLTEESKKYSGSLPKIGIVSYLYQRIPISLNICSAFGNHTLMLVWIIYRVEIPIKLLWMICYCLHQTRNLTKTTWKIC